MVVDLMEISKASVKGRNMKGNAFEQQHVALVRLNPIEIDLSNNIAETSRFPTF